MFSLPCWLKTNYVLENLSKITWGGVLCLGFFPFCLELKIPYWAIGISLWADSFFELSMIVFNRPKNMLQSEIRNFSPRELLSKLRRIKIGFLERGKANKTKLLLEALLTYFSKLDSEVRKCWKLHLTTILTLAHRSDFLFWLNT